MKTKIIKFFNKFKDENYINSSLGVSCVKGLRCDSRHSQLCENCLYNVSNERGNRTSYFVPRDN